MGDERVYTAQIHHANLDREDGSVPVAYGIVQLFGVGMLAVRQGWVCNPDGSSEEFAEVLGHHGVIFSQDGELKVRCFKIPCAKKKIAEKAAKYLGLDDSVKVYVKKLATLLPRKRIPHLSINCRRCGLFYTKPQS